MVLRADDTNAIKLRLRRDNLYLVGFQIEDPLLLGFTGGYDALLKASNGDYLDNVNLGRVVLLEAVKQLNNPNTAYDTRAKSLIVVLIMICESLRYTYITEFLAPTFVNTSPSPTVNPNSRTIALIKNWGKLSELLLVREQSPTHYFPSNPPPPEMEIHNYLDAVAVLGILKEETPIRSTTLRTTIVDNDEQQYYYPLGEPMVEVIWVKIDSVCDLYGTIQVSDGAGECWFGDTNYIVLSDAVKAKLEVTLIKGVYGAETTHVYGDLTARIGKFKEGSVMFKKASNEPIGVTSGQLIPLLKSTVAVPLNSSIIVEANISVPGDDGFAKCLEEFPALLSGTSEKSISGKSGEIRVKVTWDREM
ncbi:hypothetical protein J5N97_029787 [Dioscorea zingiberensis]|uniref:rRNA N-glycosylase n=1 Tax=Dioscorea zingiberensis TaxID=325984 RepID=A0A9D5BW61_9LILI|nr:hypothetical protein J5N97_029787 [Dioscorea zingiberensis]